MRNDECVAGDDLLGAVALDKHAFDARIVAKARHGCAERL